MNLSAYTYRLQNLLQEAKNLLIFIKKNPDVDAVAAALALYLSLAQKGKKVTVVCPDKMTVAFGELFAVDKIADKITTSGNNLVISFPYIEGSIEKVSYNIENNKFNLVIEPKNKENIVDQQNIEFSNTGSGDTDFDLTIFVGVANPSDLGEFQNSQAKTFSEKPSVLLNVSPVNLPFGTLSIIPFGSASLSEIIALLLSKINYPLDRDIVDNLFKGIKDKTGNFARGSADSFEAAAVCLRKKSNRLNASFRPNQNSSQTPDFLPKTNEAKKTPPDWLKPKIFRSGSGSQNKQATNSSVLSGPDKGTLL